MRNPRPQIIVFCCNWCSYAGADHAGVSRLEMKPHFKVIRTMCSGGVDSSFILDAFASGADGVMITGCHPGECHYVSGNYKTVRRVLLLKRMLVQFGIEPERLRLEWISAAEGAKFRDAVNAFVDEIGALAPLHEGAELVVSSMKE